MAAADDVAAKQRIITHMNNDHHESIVRLAEHFAKLPRLQSRKATLKDISLDKLVIAVGTESHTIPLNPPMSSYRDARECMVRLDAESIADLGRSKVTIKEYRAPRGFQAVIFVAILGTYVVLSRRSNVLPGSLPYELLFKRVPRFAAFAAKYRDWILWPTAAAHAIEAVMMARKMEEHSVPLFSSPWWSWVASCFIEGIGSFHRLDAIVKETKKKQEKH